ncbi:cellulose-binding domain-containing protein [Actinoplanes regularis]|uniref:cellulose-binding domain-containing protein n=1 Tax=Actinoplanes regularis TaxID=52697 RepID=UPI001EF35386|nr:cellulose-binding domain-containing protein [Actinoplanes regularis]
MSAEINPPPESPTPAARPARRTRLPRLIAGPAVLLAAAGFVMLAGNPADAAAGCRVDYTVNQWSTGFTGNVTITNLGSAINGWTLQFDYAGNQQITQSWNSTYTQSGQHVTLRDAGYNAAVATNASVTAGFNATYSGGNAAPTAFTLNGVACTGATTPTTSPTTTPTTAPTTTPPTGDPWNPPAQYVTPLANTWKHQEDTYGDLYGFRNYLFDQVMAANGSINYCVRWESTATVTATLRDQIQTALQRQFQKWVDQLNENGTGWNNWPYKQIPVKVVGWAVRDRSQLQWSDSSVDIYVNDLNEGAPQCSPPCGRFFHQDGNYSGCPGGAAHHYDMSLWLTDGMTGGAGGDWGQRIGKEYYVGALSSENIHILLHEIGHSWGLNDFYDFDPLPSEGFVMKAGSATQITVFDKWMLRDFWRHLKNRYGL